MFVILLIGLLLGSGIYARRLSQRSAHYRRATSNHTSIEKLCRMQVTGEESLVRTWRNTTAYWANIARNSSNLDQSLDQLFPGLSRDNWSRFARYERQLQQSLRQLEHSRAVAEHYAVAERKYEHAASHPWENVPPDPSEPAPPEPLPKPHPPPTPSSVEQPRWLLTLVDAHPRRQRDGIFALPDRRPPAMIPGKSMASSVRKGLRICRL